MCFLNSFTEIQFTLYVPKKDGLFSATVFNAFEDQQRRNLDSIKWFCEVWFDLKEAYGASSKSLNQTSMSLNPNTLKSKMYGKDIKYLYTHCQTTLKKI